MFGTLLTPKARELIATPYRFKGNKDKAKRFFEENLEQVFINAYNNSHIEYPLTIFYAFKQAEAVNEGTASTGWETMLEGLMRSQFSITSTWPMRTELTNRMLASGTNALASSVVLSCRKRPSDAPLATRRDFLLALRNELPDTLKTLQQGNIAPVDLAQAAIGPGMAVFSRYSKVVEADGSPMRVRTALALINHTLDEFLSEQEGDYDSDTRWALAWFEQYSYESGDYGVAETLSTAKNTSVRGMVEAGILHASAGKVRLLSRSELPDDWNPSKDERLPIWEVTQHLIRALESGGEGATAALLRQVDGLGESARELAYRLYTLCERKGWAKEATGYNSLVVSWSEINKRADELNRQSPSQASLDF